MNNETGKDIMEIKEELVDIKKEILKLNDLISSIVEDFKSNLDKKIKEKDSREIDYILKKCFDNF